MKTRFKSNQEVCHVWAAQSQQEGRGSNLSFYEGRLHSYGWYTIGMFVKENVILTRLNKYSSSTSRHINLMYRAIPSYCKTISCNYLPDRYDEIYDSLHDKNINDFVKRIKESERAFHSSTLYKEWCYRNYLQIVSDLHDYCEIFGIDIPEYIKIDEEYAKQQIETATKKAKEKEEKLKQEYANAVESSKQELKDLMADWINNKINHNFIIKKVGKRNITIGFLETYLRVKNNKVETSKGATVPLKEAKLLYHMIKDKKDIKGHKIGSYTVIGINGTLKIGCHEITREEIERFANSQNW